MNAKIFDSVSAFEDHFGTQATNTSPIKCAETYDTSHGGSMATIMDRVGVIHPQAQKEVSANAKVVSSLGISQNKFASLAQEDVGDM